MLDVVTAQSISHQVGPQKRALRAVARETGVSRNTVRRYARGAEPGQSAQSRPRSSPKTDAAREALRALYEELSAQQGKKQRLTAYRAFALLRARGVDVGYSLVKQLAVEERHRDTKTVIASVPSTEQVLVGFRRTRPRFIVRCAEQDFSIYVALDAFLGSEEVGVTVRFDSDTASSQVWSISTDHRAAFAESPEDFLAAMMGKSKLLMRLTPYSESPVTFSFDIAGIDRLVPQIIEPCGIKPPAPLYCTDGNDRYVWGAAGKRPPGSCSLSPWTANQAIRGNLTIHGPVVESLTSLGKIPAIDGDLTVSETRLQDLAFLEGLSRIGGSITLIGNQKLNSLDALPSIKDVGRTVTMRTNGEIDKCLAITWFQTLARAKKLNKLSDAIAVDFATTERSLKKCGADPSLGSELPPDAKSCELHADCPGTMMCDSFSDTCQ